VVEFLWASLAVFDDDSAVDTTEIYRAQPFELYQVAEARARILRLLAETSEGASLERLLPEPAEDPDGERWGKLRRRSGWASTLIAGLELAKQGAVVLGQGRDFEPIHVAPA
jgi:segregation and condensation protein A